jgi:hypothetical protein
MSTKRKLSNPERSGARTTPSNGRRPRAWLIVLAPAALAFVAGCNWITAATVLLAPRHIDKAQFKLTDQRLVVFVDYANPEQEAPVFDRALYDQVASVFREQPKFVPSHLVAYKEVVDLRRQNADFRTWNIQRIGHELGADQVLYIRVEELQLRPAPDHPLIEPRVTLRIKVIGVPDPAEHARLWPADPKGWQVQCKRMAEEASSPDAIDAAAAKLGREAARQVAYPFYDVDAEESVPKEA